MGMDKTYFVQKTAMTLLAHNPKMHFQEIWEKANGLADVYDGEWGISMTPHSNRLKLDPEYKPKIRSSIDDLGRIDREDVPF